MTKPQQIELIREAVSNSVFLDHLPVKDFDAIFAICAPWVKLNETLRIQAEIAERQDLLAEVNKIGEKSE